MPPLHRLTAAAVGVLVTGSVGISVVIVGWHHPSDVLGGFLVAGAWGLAAAAFLRFRADRGAAVRAGERPHRRPLAVSTE